MKLFKILTSRNGMMEGREEQTKHVSDVVEPVMVSHKNDFERKKKEVEMARKRREEEKRLRDEAAKRFSVRDVETSAFSPTSPQVKEVFEVMWECKSRIEKARRPGTTSLALDDSRLQAIPPNLLTLCNLKELNLAQNYLEDLPDTLDSALPNLTILNLQGNSLSEVPIFTRLESLNVANNKIQEIPSKIDRYASLKTLQLHGNRISAVRPELCRLGSLEFLSLSYNAIASLPSEISRLRSLKTLLLNDNELTALPLSMGVMVNLQRLNLSDNPLKEPVCSIYTAGLDALLNYLATASDAASVEQSRGHLYQLLNPRQRKMLEDFEQLGRQGLENQISTMEALRSKIETAQNELKKTRKAIELLHVEHTDVVEKKTELERDMSGTNDVTELARLKVRRKLETLRSESQERIQMARTECDEKLRSADEIAQKKMDKVMQQNAEQIATWERQKVGLEKRIAEQDYLIKEAKEKQKNLRDAIKKSQDNIEVLKQKKVTYAEELSVRDFVI